MDAPNAPAATPDIAPKRRRNAAATRQAILESARTAFTQYGYDGVGLREIAQNAGVTAMLVNRYFGSKEKLFEEVVEASLAMPGILRNEIAKKPKDSAALSQALAAALTAKTADDGARLDGISLLIRSASNPQAAAILRERSQGHIKPLLDLLTGPNIEQRASLFLAVVAGLQLMRRIIALPALTEADTAALTTELQGLFTVLLCEDAPKTGGVTEK